MSEIDHIVMCLERGWRVVAPLIGALARVSNPRGAARREALALVRIAEAMLRRLFILMALPLKLSAAPRGLVDLPDFANFTVSEMPILRFGLTEALAAYPPEPSIGPRIRSLDFFGLPEAKAPVMPSKAHDLAARIAALQTAFEHRAKHARRMAKWIARARALIGPGRRFALRTGRPPGYSPRRRARDPVTQDSLMALHGFAWRALAPP